MQYLEFLSLLDSYQLDDSGDWAALLNPTTLPSLRHIQLLFSISSASRALGTVNTRRSNAIEAALLSLAPQLSVLAIREHLGPSIANSFATKDWSQFSQLEDLTLNTSGSAQDENHWTSSLFPLPPELKSLAILVPFKSARIRLYRDVKAAIPSWRGFTGAVHLLLLDDGVPMPDENESKTALLSAAAAHGVQVRLEMREQLSDSWEI